MHRLPKVNKTPVFPTEMTRKLCEWHARRKRDHMHCVGCKLAEWPREFAFWSKPEEVSPKIRTSAPMCVCVCVCVCVCTAQPSSTPFLTLPIRIFRIIKRKGKKQIIFLYISVVVFFSYTVIDLVSHPVRSFVRSELQYDLKLCHSFKYNFPSCVISI